MHCPGAHGHPPTPCRARAAPAAASRSAACTRAAAFREAPIPHSCSVGAAHVILTPGTSAQQASATPGDATPQQHAAWQPVSAGAALSRATAGSCNAAAVAAAVADAVAAAAPASPTSEHHHLGVQQQQNHVLHLQQPQHATQLQHAQHAGAAPGAHVLPDGGPAGLWRAQHTAALSQWRLLSDPQQDKTTTIILSCSSQQQLLGWAQTLLRQPASKWHYARLAAMAAVLATPQPGAAGAAMPQPAPGWQHRELTCTVLQAVTAPCSSEGVPALLALRGAHLAETLHAVQLLLLHDAGHCSTQAHQQQQQQQQLLAQEGQQQHSLAQQLQQQQQRLRQVLAGMPESLLLSAVHGCSSVQQLRSVVALTADCFSALHLKACFVQLARLAGDSSSRGSSSSSSRSSGTDVWQALLELLPQHLSALQPHHCASILWSVGQLQPACSPVYSSNSSGGGSAPADSSGSSSSPSPMVQQQLLQGALAGLERLNPRVCAQLLHGAARLRLEVPAASLQALQQHTQQQLQLCDPQALACMLWSLATLHGPSTPGPNPAWLEAFYSSSWKWLRPSSSSTSHSNGDGSSTTHHQQQQQWRRKDACSCFEPCELSALLTAACRLQLQPPSGWLAAIADSSSRQMGSFGHPELGLLLWGFARLQYAPPRGLLTAAASRLQQLEGPQALQPQALSLLVYGATRLLQWQRQQDAQQQQQQQQPPGGEQQLVWAAQDQVLARCGGKFEQWSGHDLALLAWSLGMQHATQHTQQGAHQHHQRQQGAHGPRQLGRVLLPALLQAATAKLQQQQQFSPQGVSMLLWGLGSTLQASAAASTSSSSSGSGESGSGGTSSSSAVVVDQAMYAAFLEAASAAVTQHAKSFSGHELSLVVWGIGAVARLVQSSSPTGPAGAGSSRGSGSGSSSGSGASSPAGWRAPTPAAVVECMDLLFCQLLDASDQLSNYQLAAVIQGFSWAQHPRGLDLLHLALQYGRHAGRAQAVQPQELLLFLRACVAYKYVPEGSAWRGVLGAAERVRQQLRPTELAQLLYLLGKLQVLSNRRSKQRAAQAAAASAAEAAAALSAWQTAPEQRRSARALGQRHKQQALQRVVLLPLVPQVLLEQLLAQAGCSLEHCSSRDVSLMLWGVSHLQRHQNHQQQQHCKEQQQQQGAAGQDSTAGDGSCVVGPLLDRAYPYTLQQLGRFSPGNLATLLYALQRLRTAPDAAWLRAVALHFDDARLSAMDGQSLAVLGLALAGLNWVPPKAWLGAYVRAVAAADTRGLLLTTWQRRCIANSLAALNPLAGHAGWTP